MNLLTYLFGEPEEINGHGRCATYLYRWVVFKSKHGNLYIHKFVGDDWSYDLHDHPKRFVSIGLWGSYFEQTPNGNRRWRAPWFRTFPAEHQHRITTPWGTCWTLVFVFPTERIWGFWHHGEFMDWKNYVRGKGGIADKQRGTQHD